MPAFEVNHPCRLAPTKVLGPPSTGVLRHTPFDIVSDSRVQRIIVAADHVDVPIHRDNGSAQIVIATTPMALASIRLKAYCRTTFAPHAPLPLAPFKALNRRSSDARCSRCTPVSPKLTPDDQHQQCYCDENQQL
jgi:malonyl CoA-acyl carrier protein transacylase